MSVNWCNRLWGKMFYLHMIVYECISVFTPVVWMQRDMSPISPAYLITPWELISSWKNLICTCPLDLFFVLIRWQSSSRPTSWPRAHSAAIDIEIGFWQWTGRFPPPLPVKDCPWIQELNLVLDVMKIQLSLRGHAQSSWIPTLQSFWFIQRAAIHQTW